MYRPRHLLLLATLTCPLAGFIVGCATAAADDTSAQALPRPGDARVSYSEDDVPPGLKSGAEEATTTAAQPQKQLPGQAVELNDWRGGRELTYEPETPGFIYVFDQTDNRIVYSGHLRPGERFVLDRQRSRATIDGEIAYAQDRDEARDYKVYFDRDD
jgi:hypothetical protein